MNAIEAQMLQRSVEQFVSTIARNRMMGQRQREHAVQAELEREALNIRRDELGERRSEREQSRADLSEYRDAMATIQREAKEMQARHYQMMEDLGMFEKFQEGLKNGTMNLEKLKQQQAENPILKRLGIGVDLFQVPPANKAGFQTAPGHNFQLADDYWERANAAQRAGDGEMAERYRARARILERGGTANRATITSKLNSGTSVTRQVSDEDLDAAMAEEMSKQPKTDPLQQAELVPIDAEIAGHLGEIAQGDERYGFLDLGGRRADRVRELEAKKAQIIGSGSPAPGSLGTGTNAVMAAPVGAPAAPATNAPSPPKIGDVIGGHRFNGKFPPNDPRAWEKVR